MVEAQVEMLHLALPSCGIHSGQNPDLLDRKLPMRLGTLLQSLVAVGSLISLRAAPLAAQAAATDWPYYRTSREVEILPRRLDGTHYC